MQESSLPVKVILGITIYGSLWSQAAGVILDRTDHKIHLPYTIKEYMRRKA
jgi:hypothetical protein